MTIQHCCESGTRTPICGKYQHHCRRFLRARKFDPVKAQKQFSDTEKWRKDIGVDKLFASFDPVEFESARRFYPRWTGRRDKVSSRVLEIVLY